MGKRRKRGNGTLRQRNDGRWEGRIVIGYDEKKRPITKGVSAKTKREAEEKLEELKKSLDKISEDQIKSNMKFGVWMKYWYEKYCKPSLKESTRITYEHRIYGQIVAKIGDIPLDKITTGVLDRFYAQLKVDGRLIRRELYGTGLSNAVIRSIHAHCRASLQKAKIEGLIKRNPADLCKLPSKKNPEVEVLTPAEMQRLLIQAKEDGFYEMFLLDLSTGMRRGELLALQWKDINFRRREIQITKQVHYIKGVPQITTLKTSSSERTIIIPQPLVDVLKRYKKTINSKWVFPSPVKDEDVPRDPSACRKSLNKILERAGCKHVPFHALRHTFATQSLRYGMDIKTLAATIGHASVETTLNVYSHTTQESMMHAANRIDKVLGVISGEEREEIEEVSKMKPPKTPREKFEPYKGKKRKPGSGYVKQISPNCWQGRYTPTVDGKRLARNVYAPTEAECERKLAELIKTLKAEIAEMKSQKSITQSM